MSISDQGVQESNKFCSCEELPLPYERRIWGEDYFKELQQFVQDIEDSIAHPTCSTDDSLSFDTPRFDEVIAGTCQKHDELRRAKRRGAAFAKRDTIYVLQHRQGQPTLASFLG